MRKTSASIALVLLSLVLAAIFFWFFRQATETPFAAQEKQAEVKAERYKTFSGSVLPFERADLWVLDTAASRDLDKLLAYFQARSAGLHHVFKKYAKARKLHEDVMFGVHMHIAETGEFDSVTVAFTETQNADLAADICDYIKSYWHYRPAVRGTELILPIRFRAK